MQKRLKLVAVLVVVALLVVAIKYLDSFDHASISPSDNSIVKSETLQRLLVNGVNSGAVRVTADGLDHSYGRHSVYFDIDMNLMASTDVIGKILGCAVSRYTDSRVLLEKGSNKVMFIAGEDYVLVDDVRKDISGHVTVSDEAMYIPISVAAEYLGYDYEWNSRFATVNFKNRFPDEKIYPYRYDYRESGRIGVVKDQANLGTCWAFASLTALESSLLPYHAYDFSEDHLTRKNGYNLSQNDGGEYNMTMAYLAGWKGPVYEEQDPYGDGFSPDGLTPVAHVQEMQIVAGKDYDAIKRAVFLYGGVQSSLYMSGADINGQDGTYYNATENAYCYIGTQKANHDVVIVGWDDSYAADNFATAPAGDGAFICVNSWGDSFGDKGFFYVSYYDTNIGMHNLVYTRVEKTTNYDKIYQTDDLGWVGLLGYDREQAYFANVYETTDNELLRAVGFYATAPGTEYKIYLAEDVTTLGNVENMRVLAEGGMANAGYYTVDFAGDIELAAAKRYGIVVYISSPNSKKPVAIECYSDKSTQNLNLEDGEGYISLAGRNWERVEKTQHCNLCLKMFTDIVE